MFNDAKVPLAINQCVSIYPSEPFDLELNQIDLLEKRYPDNVIGLSSHEYKDYSTSLAIAYGKGARTFERHIDMPHPTNMSPYNMLPEQCETWFRTFRSIKEMCGAPGDKLRIPTQKEIDYINEHVRGLFARKDLKKGLPINQDHFYMAVPVHQGQLSCRELMSGGTLKRDLAQDAPLMLEDVEAEYLSNQELVEEIRKRGRTHDETQ